MRVVPVPHAYDEHAFAHLWNPVVGGEIEPVGYRVAGGGEILEHLVEERLAVGHQQTLDVLGDKGVGPQSLDYIDHLSVEDRPLAVRHASRIVDRHVLTWKSADNEVGGFGKRVHVIGDIAAIDVVVQIGTVRSTGLAVDVVGPYDFEG